MEQMSYGAFHYRRDLRLSDPFTSEPLFETIQLSTANGTKEGDLVFVHVPDAEGLHGRETLRVEIDGCVMAIAKIDNQLFAFQEFCTHRFGPLSEGCFDGFNVECPWHRSRFDVRTGKVTNGPAKIDLKTFRIETRDGKIFIGVPALKQKS